MAEYDLAYRAIAAHAARLDLYRYARWMMLRQRGYPWQRAEHHRLICDALMRVYRGECKRLIINVPPRYGKTQLGLDFLGWTLGHCPDAEYIYTSYSGRLAATMSWQAREAVLSEVYREVWPEVRLRTDSSARDEWRTTAGGCVYAVGTGGSITGYGAGKARPGWGGCIIIDDPHKADEARSDVIREGVIEWYQTTLASRVNSPDTPIILIMQRLHERDLAGWLLAGGTGERWEHVCLPALRDDGTALWPAKHTAEALRRMRDASPYTFAGQYQQAPAAPEGNVIKPHMLQMLDARPVDGWRWVRAWDLGASVPKVGTDPDWTVGAMLGKHTDGRICIADIVRLRGLADEVEAAIVNTAHQDGRPVRVSLPQDPGQAGKSQVLYLTRKLAGHAVISSPESGDKVTRAEPLAAQINVGNISLVRGAWNEALTQEMRMFPNGSHDDQVDACSRAFGELIRPPAPARRTQVNFMGR